jgi:hypothetical protein
MERAASERDVSMMGLRSWGIGGKRSVERVRHTGCGDVELSSSMTRYHVSTSGSSEFVVGDDLTVIRYHRPFDIPRLRFHSSIHLLEANSLHTFSIPHPSSEIPNDHSSALPFAWR